MIEFELEPGVEGPAPHSHSDHTDAFFVLAGELEFRLEDTSVVAGSGSFVAAPPGVAHTFTSGPRGGRMLSIHAPGTGFEERLRAT